MALMTMDSWRRVSRDSWSSVCVSRDSWRGVSDVRVKACHVRVGLYAQHVRQLQ